MFVYLALFLSPLIEVKMSILHFNLVEADESRKNALFIHPIHGLISFPWKWDQIVSGQNP